MLCYVAHHFCKIPKLVQLSFPVLWVFSGVKLHEEIKRQPYTKSRTKYLPKHLLNTILQEKHTQYKVLEILTLSFISKSLTIKVATKDFKGAANWSGASMAIWPMVTNGVMRCSKLLGSRLLCRG